MDCIVRLVSNTVKTPKTVSCDVAHIIHDSLEEFWVRQPESQAIHVPKPYQYFTWGQLFKTLLA